MGSNPIFRPMFFFERRPMPERRTGPTLARTGNEAAERVQRVLEAAPPHRILVICREHIGDIVNTTGAIACLRASFPDAKLVVDVGERAVPVLENFPGIDEIWPRPTHQGALGKWRYIRRLRRCGFDLAVIFDDSNPHVLHAKLGGIPFRVGIWRGVKYESLYCAYVPLRRERHELRDHCRLLLELMGCDTSDCSPRLYVSEADRAAASAILREMGLPNGHPLVGIHPGASEPRRRWPIEHFATLVDSLEGHADVLLLGGDADRQAIEDLRRRCRRNPHMLPRPLSILQFAALCASLDLMICGDTGPMHLAATMGTRVVVLYGPAYPEHTGPYGRGHVILQEPCSCPERTPKVCPGECLRNLRPERVRDAACEALDREVGVV